MRLCIGVISWHKNGVFISEVLRFEELALELITLGLYRVFLRDMEIGELNVQCREPCEFLIDCEPSGAVSSVRCIRSWRPFCRR